MVFLQKKIEIIVPGVDSKEKFDSLVFKRQNHINPSAMSLLFVGLKSKEKGIFTLIEAMKKVWLLEPNINLILIGPSTPDFLHYFSNLDKNFKNKIIDLGITDEITKNTAISACDIFVMPSNSESFGMVILEAWYYKKPVIGCNVSPVNEIVKNRKNGLLINYNSIVDLFDAIMLLLNDSVLRTDLGKNGIAELIKYDWNESCTKFELICSSILKDNY